MSLRMRQATMGGGFVVTRWCGGIRLAPAGDGPEHTLASEPIYLDTQDLINLLVFCTDDLGAAEILDDHVVEGTRQWLRRQPGGSSEFWKHDERDAVVDYWDRRP